MPVHGALCIVDADLPMLGTLTFRGISLSHPRPLAKRINRFESVAAERIRPIAAALAAHFAPA